MRSLSLLSLFRRLKAEDTEPAITLAGREMCACITTSTWFRTSSPVERERFRDELLRRMGDATDFIKRQSMIDYIVASIESVQRENGDPCPNAKEVAKITLKECLAKFNEMGGNFDFVQESYGKFVNFRATAEDHANYNAFKLERRRTLTLNLQS